MSINVVSFGYKYGVPLEADLVFDVRFMPNPYYVPELRYQTGMNDDVYNYVFSFPQTKEFLSKLEQSARVPPAALSGGGQGRAGRGRRLHRRTAPLGVHRAGGDGVLK